MNIDNLVKTIDLRKVNGELANLDLLEEALLIYQNFVQLNKDMVIIKNNLFHATKLYEELSNYLDDTQLSLFAFDESLMVEDIASSPELNLSRLETLVKTNNKQPKIIITHALGLLKPIMARQDYLNKIISYQVNDQIDLNNIAYTLSSMGYTRANKVSIPCEFSIRGGVLDIFIPNASKPVRIDIFDNLIESIKTFDITSQRSRITLDHVDIYPATLYNRDRLNELVLYIDEFVDDETKKAEALSLKDTNTDLFASRYYKMANQKDSIIAYLNDPLIITSSYEDIIRSLQMIQEENVEYLKSLAEENEYIIDYDILLDIKEVLGSKYLNIKSFQTSINDVTFILEHINQFANINDLKLFIEQHRDDQIYIALDKKHEQKIVMEYLDNNDISYTKDNLYDINVKIVDQSFSRGFIDEASQVVVLTSQEIFGVKKRKRNILNKFSNAIDIMDLQDLNENDYIIHQYHGIGKYLGIIQLKVDNIYKDFLHILYKNNEKLYIPIEQFNMIKKYASSEGHEPKINSLGGVEWRRVKQKVKNKLDDMMDELLALYAARQEKVGYAFSKDNSIIEEFENDFEYELTPDQAKAIAEVKADMESDEVMDRLICGDVGYGKTEVALRAIMKAVLDNKQVAFLCPTTILTRQHYLTLTERFAGYPINIVQVSRNTTAKKFKQIIQGVKDHQIDIVVGTHKLLNKDLKFNDLGLLVIDEEQRFGVKDKEKIKQLKTNVDVLTLSATPIPRTLQMSLTGLRKMSLLQTPPINRVPIQTYVVEKNDYLIKDIIERELARNGQVFYVHNRTMDIDQVALKLQGMFPDVKVATIHGKMNKAQVEDTMIQFDNNQYQILVSTTIIETGIDIPNANTIIIENANNFGLAQLYQIKGRVGRSDRVAYAYLMYDKNRVLNEEAAKRLQAIKELTKLGSGYKIALRDLAIRGAGDILGKTQAGNIDSVGYETYLELLQEVIDERKGIVKTDVEVESINLKNTGYIPNDYQISDDNKLSLYQKIYKVDDLNKFDALYDELTDLYGKLPASITDIIEKRRLELLVSQIDNLNLIDEDEKMTIQLPVDINDNAKVKAIYQVLDDYEMPINVEIKYQKIHLNFTKNKYYLKTINDILFNIKDLL